MVFPFFVSIFEYKGFGCGKNLIRNLENFNEQGVLITFDDGPSSQFTMDMVKILKENKIKAIFFLVGESTEKNTNLIKEMKDGGMELGVHSYSHKPLPFLFTAQIEKEIDKTVQAIKASGTGNPKYFRPPWGLYNKEVIDIVNLRGLKTMLWSKSAKDWSGTSKEEIIKNATNQLNKGDILLFHDGHKEGVSRKETLKALPEIIKIINDKFINH
jgi:peptidoglycan/xylan/chitin deacetylase (PgdA/CDA1 family)